MRVLAIHNYYLERGGEDAVFEDETALLEQHGHEVIRYRASNRELVGKSGLVASRLAVWNQAAYRDILSLIARSKPDIVHCHNTFAFISPAVTHAAFAARVPVVQTLHNYRLVCPNAILYRDGRICHDCIGRAGYIPAVLHSCYRADTMATAAVCLMLTVHRLLGTWQRKTSLFIAPTEFAKGKLAVGGLPARKIEVKPNFAPEPSHSRHDKVDYALYVGRLSPEKGIILLLNAWHMLKGIPLKIAGTGPLADFVAKYTADHPNVEYVGWHDSASVQKLLSHAAFLICPSLCYEAFPRAAVEAFSLGVPIVATGHGPFIEIVEDNGAGLCFLPQDHHDLAVKAAMLWEDGKLRSRLSKEAGLAYREKYSPVASYRRLVEIYARALHSSSSEG